MINKIYTTFFILSGLSFVVFAVMSIYYRINPGSEGFDGFVAVIPLLIGVFFLIVASIFVFVSSLMKTDNSNK